MSTATTSKLTTTGAGVAQELIERLREVARDEGLLCDVDEFTPATEDEVSRFVGENVKTDRRSLFPVGRETTLPLTTNSI